MKLLHGQTELGAVCNLEGPKKHLFSVTSIKLIKVSCSVFCDVWFFWRYKR